MKTGFEVLHKKSIFRRRAAILIILVLLVPCIMAGWPVNTLEIRFFKQGEDLGNDFFLRTPVLPGRNVTNTIIHSVQLTPVIDEYRIQEGRIWAWREKIKSHNAGLPSLKPERGRFIYEPPWMIVEGTGQSWDNIHYRVGTEEFGKNKLCVPPEPCRELWREIPGARLVLSVGKVSVMQPR